MSGIAALFARDGSVVDAADVDAVVQCQAHRGPDGLRQWCDGPVGLGLAALDPNGAGHAVGPLVTDGGRLALAGDLRIDNRRELAGVLDGIDRSGVGVSDAEIVLAAYRRWGADAPQRFEGAFAMAIWDAGRGRILLARDHLGVKPLAYHLSRDLLVCASEADAVACAQSVPTRVNEARIADFLVSELEGVDHTCTFFEGVERLPPAHVLVVDRDGHRLRRFWQPDPGNELHLESDEAYADAFSHVFRESVSSCLEGISAPGLLLSGGLDSNAIEAVARSLAESGEAEPLRLFSATDEENDSSPETALILATIERLGRRAEILSQDTVSALTPPVRRALLDCREPFDCYMTVNRLLFSLAADEGCRTILDGVDGDVVASTSVPVVHLLRRGSILRPWREAVGRRRLHPDAPNPVRVFAGGAVRAWAPGGVRRMIRRLRDRRGRVDDTLDESLINRDFAKRIAVADRLEQLRSFGGDDHRGDPFTGHAAAVGSPYVAAALERYDRVAAESGVECRHPFFDLRLVKFCLSLPWDLKVRNGWTKFILRLATEGRVGESIRWRHEYGDVLWRPASWVIAEERRYLLSILEEHEDLLRSYVDFSRLDRVRMAFDRNPTDSEEVWIWEAASLAVWLTRFHSSHIGLPDRRRGLR